MINRLLDLYGIDMSLQRAVIAALGGIAAVCALTGQRRKTVSAWQAAYESFPPDTYVVMILALYAKGYSAPAALWRQVNADGVTLVPAALPVEATQSV